jgi:tetratricopeptide (TPR) repeat protein
MPATSRLLLFVLFVFFQTNYFSFSQPTTLSIRELVQKFEAKNDYDDTGFAKVSQEMARRDSTFVIATLGEVEKVKSSSHYYYARFFMLKAYQTFRFNLRNQGFLVKKYCEHALAEAYGTGDEYLISSICQRYGELMYASQEIELSATYYLKSEEINQQLGKKVESCAGMWLQLGEVLFHTREYEKSAFYLSNGLQNWHDTSGQSDYYRIRFWNALGQDYQQMGQLDSALMNYHSRREGDPDRRHGARPREPRPHRRRVR